MSEFEHMDRDALTEFAAEMRNQRDLAHQRMEEGYRDSALRSALRDMQGRLAAANNRVRQLSERLVAAERRREQYGARNGGLATSNRHLRKKLSTYQHAADLAKALPLYH